MATRSVGRAWFEMRVSGQERRKTNVGGQRRMGGMGKIMVKCPECGSTVDSGGRSERQAFDEMTVMNGTFECPNGHAGGFSRQDAVFEED